MAATSRTETRAQILRAHGAGPSEVDELLRYNAAVLDADAIPPGLVLPLPDEPFVSRWDTYRSEAASGGVYRCLWSRFPQLQFPIETGISDSDEYKSAVRRGLPSGRSAEHGLQLERPDLLSLSIHPSLAGRIPILVTEHRHDFLSLVRALANRNEPVAVPDSMGGCIIAGYNNWDRIGAYRRSWEARHPGSDVSDWQAEFQALSARKELYQDTFILLSAGSYSGVDASGLGLDPVQWQHMSVAIRRAHECTHYFTRRVFSSMRNNVLDEVVADFIALIEATGTFDTSWFLAFFGLENYPEFRPSGRLTNYMGSPPLSPSAFQILQRLVWRVGHNLGQFHAQHRERLRHASTRARVILTLSSMTVEELAEDTAPDQVSARLTRLDEAYTTGNTAKHN